MDIRLNLRTLERNPIRTCGSRPNDKGFARRLMVKREIRLANPGWKPDAVCCIYGLKIM